MAARKKSVKTGGDKPVIGGKKKSDNSTSYGKKTPTYSASAKPPAAPYGQLHKAVRPKPKK